MRNSPAWTSTPPTPTASRASPPCTVPVRGRRPGGQRRDACSSRPGPATTTASRSRSSPSCACPATPSTTCSCRTRCSTPCGSRSRSWSAASADLPPVLVVGAPLRPRQPGAQRRGRGAPRPGPRRGAEVLPADVPGVLRAPLVRPRRRRHAAPIVVAGQEVPIGPDLLFDAVDVPGLVLHVEVCEDMWVPVPPSAEAALAGRHACSPTSPAARSPSAAPRTAGCWSARRPRAASRPTSTPRPGRASPAPTCPGTARRWSTRTASCSPRPSGSPTVRGVRSSTSTSTGSAWSGCAPAPSTTTAARWRPRHRPGFRTHRVPARPADRRRRAAAQRGPLPVRARRPGAARPGLLRGLQHPGLRARAAAAGHRQPQDRDRGVRAAWTPPTR